LNINVIDCIKIVVVLLVLSGLSACRSEPPSADVGLQSGVKSNPDAEHTELAHANHKRAKPGAAVSLKDSSPLYASVPGVYEYRLVLVSPIQSGSMTVVALAGDGLKILSSETRFEFVLENGGEYVVPLTISAAQEGRFYLQLHVSVVVDGQPRTRVVAAIVQVGEPSTVKQKASIKISSDTDSDEVIVLPAQETISPQ